MTPLPLRPFMGSRSLGELLAAIGPVNCLDIGARGGPKDDLLPLAAAASIFCFEPDAEEADRMNRTTASNGSPYLGVQFFPVALSGSGGERTLHITRHAGASSLLPPDPAAGARYSRPHYTDVVRTLPVQTETLDGFAVQAGLPDISHIKIDVEGLELEILQAAEQMLSESVVTIRSEVSFLPMRTGQPNYCDLAAFLARFDFVPMAFAELHHWRRYSAARHLKWTDDPIPFSRGQLAHGDMLFFRSPESLPTASDQERLRALKAAFLAMNFGFIDHAAFLFKQPGIEAEMAARGIAIERELRTVAQEFARQWQGSGVGEFFRRRKNKSF